MSGEMQKSDNVRFPNLPINPKLPEIQIKPFWKSKTFWALFITGLISLYNSVSPETGLPPVPDFILTILAALGLYTGRRLVEHNGDNHKTVA